MPDDRRGVFDIQTAFSETRDPYKSPQPRVRGPLPAQS